MSNPGCCQGLGFGPFVDAENQRFVGRIEIEPDYVLHFGSEVLIARDFESLDQVRLEPMRTPYPLL
jgi:hypothetical protein